MEHGDQIPAIAMGASAMATAASVEGGMISMGVLRSSADPYPLVHQLRQARQVGSFAMANRMVGLCLEVQLALQPDRDPLKGRENEPDYAERLRARAAMERRCDRLGTADGLAIGGTPLSDDEHAKRFVQARQYLGRIPHEDARALGQAFEEMIAQGQWQPLLDWLGLHAHWQGQDWRARRSVFAAALSVSETELMTQGIDGRDDLPLMLNCFRLGECSYRKDAALDRLPVQDRADARQLATEMGAAMRSGDLRPFL